MRIKNEESPVSPERARRRKLSFVEKLKVLDKLRERNRAFAEARKKLAAARNKPK